MKDADNAAYFARRERQQRELAERATNPAVAAIHRDMAERYAREAWAAATVSAGFGRG